MREIEIVNIGGQDYMVKKTSTANLSLIPVTISKKDKRTPLSNYSDDELLNEYLLRNKHDRVEVIKL